MAGVTKLNKVQLGREGTKGTEANATALWLGSVKLIDQRQSIIPNENVGYLGPVDRSYIPYADASVEFASTEANFEQICYPFAAGLQNTVSGSANGGTTVAYTYAYAAATTGAPTVVSYTVEGGDNQQEYQALYAICQEINLSGAPREAVKISSKWFARSMAKGTFTAGIQAPIVEQILFQLGKIYTCATNAVMSGTVGQQLTNTWLGFDMNIKTGMIPVATGDGSLAFSFEKCTEPDITGSIIFEHDAIGVARYDDFVAGTTKKMRLLFEGTALSGSGGTYSKKTVQIDFSMKITSVDLLDSVNGNNTVKVNYRAVYNPTAALYWQMIVCNLLATLT